MPYLDEIAAFLDDVLDVRRYDFGEDLNGIYRTSGASVQRIGLALDGSAEVAAWAWEERLDALLLHRPWKLDAGALPLDVGVLAYHLAFDERLTLGYNPWLAQVLALQHVEVLGRKAGRPLGMMGQTEEVPFAQWVRRLMDVFGGLDEIHVPAAPGVTSVAAVGAMNEQLVQDAAGAGAQVYLTGQMRTSARRAMAQTGIGVVAAGHRRSEQWGLRASAGLLQTRFARLAIRVWGV